MTRAYYLRHRKEILRKSKLYHAKQRTKAWYKKDWIRRGKKKYLEKKAAGKLWSQKHPKEAAKQARKWALAHPERRREVCRAWYHRNKEEANRRARERYWKDIEATREHENRKQRESYRKNGAKRRAYSRSYYWKKHEKHLSWVCWNGFKRRHGLKEDKTLREQFECLRKKRKQLANVVTQWREGKISETRARQLLRRLELRTRPK